MSPIVKDPDCLSPMLCHCKVACSDNTLSIMFGCKNVCRLREAVVHPCSRELKPLSLRNTALILPPKWDRHNRPAAVQGSPHTAQPPPCMNPALMSTPWYRYQDEDSPPQDHGFPRLTNEVRAPELVHVSEKNLSEIENVHGYVSHSHISPLKPALVTRFDLTYPGLTAASYLASGTFI
ncbi:hypothetical protein AAFF_G00416900 [Aldrovandia affinis]|uniref:Disks large homologue 1 N-terminal PEST domain-containing protein n=1 Tax=Aldrovandia affinis TaxID=143900 RepID=A0AAD7SAV8_9TELE|nr:hypothetical protein AAFF_G00416900 [Aldrovandia affinis]